MPVYLAVQCITGYFTSVLKNTAILKVIYCPIDLCFWFDVHSDFVLLEVTCWSGRVTRLD